MKLIHERLKWAMEQKSSLDGVEITPADIARASKSSDAAASHWVNGVNGMSAAKARLVADYLGVNALWLETGDGERCRSSPNMDAGTLERHPETLEVVRIMESTDDRGRKNILLAASYAFDEHQAHMRKINSEPLREVSQFSDEEIRIIVGYRNANPAYRSLILSSAMESDQQEAPKEAKKS
jgi:transcriptional regulator with XRE-family HTH domain